MSLWTDRELKKLISRVDELQTKVEKLEQTIMLMNTPTADPPLPPHLTLLDKQPPPGMDKRTREYREWKKKTS